MKKVQEIQKKAIILSNCAGFTVLATVVALASPQAGAEERVIDWAPKLSERQSALIAAATELLETADVSYALGGNTLGEAAECDLCNSCLEKNAPKPRERFSTCPECRKCSLDCSHFTQLVFARAGMPYPYIHTPLMLELSAEALRRRYRLVDIGRDSRAAQPGDLLVYRGHVVILERVHPVESGQRLRGDIVHATGGRDIRLPGQGIQRERMADLGGLRGPLLRILRHEMLVDMSAAPASTTRSAARTSPDVRPRAAPDPATTAPSRPRLRRVEKRNPAPN